MRPRPPTTYAVTERLDPQPHSRPCSATVSSGTRATTRAMAPHQSMRTRRGVWRRWSVRNTTIRAAMPTGTFTRKTQRQPVTPRISSWPAKNPPMTGPSTLEVREGGHEVAGVPGPLPRRHDVADDRQDQREQPAGADALERPERRELVHRRRERAQHRADDEDRDGEHEQLLAAVEVAELAVDRRGDGRGDQVRRGHPGLDGEAVEVVGDGADRRADDGLVEGGQEHPEQQPGQDREDLGVGVLTGLFRRERRCRPIVGCHPQRV